MCNINFVELKETGECSGIQLEKMSLNKEEDDENALIIRKIVKNIFDMRRHTKEGISISSKTFHFTLYVIQLIKINYTPSVLKLDAQFDF